MTDRFAFGKNWQNFLNVVDEQRVENAKRSLQALLQVDSLSGKRLLDIGCGSGLFSLAAVRLGADVYSFDYDRDAIACATELKKRFASDRPNWTIRQGSALDQEFLKSLGQFDVVYSWGVLHHTGQMWKALDHIQWSVKPTGLLAIALYNDQGHISRYWTRIKKFYVDSPRPIQFLLVLIIGIYFKVRTLAARLLKGKKPSPKERGMTFWYDLVDWVGGYPFEVATPEAIETFYRDRHFELMNEKTCGKGLGCNEFVFRKAAS